MAQRLSQEGTMLRTMKVVTSAGEDRIQEAFQYAAAGMAITDLCGRFQQTNPAYNDILGRTEAELKGHDVLSVTHPADREGCRQQIERLLRGELTSFVKEKRYLRPAGEAVWVRNSFSLLKDKADRPTHMILICNDISARMRAERLLLERERLATVGQLAASIAHEINNPLEAVMNLLYLAKNAGGLDEARQFIDQAETEVEHVAQIASQTLRFRKEQIKPTLTSVTELLESVLMLYKGKLGQAKVQVHLHKRDRPDLVCYPSEMRQVFANLVGNAIDAMPNGGKLSLRVRSSTCWKTGIAGTRVTVADTGHGMDSHTLKRICEPFFTTKGNHGTGLGLWVTATILSKHHGHLHVRSSTTPRESWTAFSLALPFFGAEGEVAGLGELHA